MSVACLRFHYFFFSRDRITVLKRIWASLEGRKKKARKLIKNVSMTNQAGGDTTQITDFA